jgi:hypothetical protein
MAWLDRRPVAVSISVALYIAACVLPAILLHVLVRAYGEPGADWRWDGYESVRSGELLFVGSFGLFTGLSGNFAVLANPALWLGQILYGLRQNRAAAACSGMALILSLFTFQLLSHPYYFDEDGVRQGYLASPQAGFYCWVAGMAIILLAGIRGALRNRL